MSDDNSKTTPSSTFIRGQSPQEIIDAARNANPHPQQGAAAAAAASPAAAPAAAEAAEQPFVVVNPALPVYQPTSAEARLQGFPLCRQQLPDGGVYHLVQLSEPSAHCRDRDGACVLETGSIVLVADHPSLLGIVALYAVFSKPDSAHPDRGCEVIFEPHRKYDGQAWSYLLRARRVVGDATHAIARPPSFALADLPIDN